jgi:hypothetical protein
MKQKLMKVAAAMLCCSVVTAAYACWTFETINCVLKGDTASVVVSCVSGTGTAGGVTYTQSQTASAVTDQLVTDYAVVPPPGPNYWSHTASKVCNMEWDYISCNGQMSAAFNLTSYPTPTLAEDCTQH